MIHITQNPAYPTGQSNYVLQNTGRHRCWACIIGMLIGLLLLGLLLACILAVDPCEYSAMIRVTFGGIF